MAEKVEAAGITVFTGFAGSELLYDGSRVCGVRTDDKGVDKKNEKKSNFEPATTSTPKIVVLAEGTRGSLTKELIIKLDLARDANPQTYGVGVKELWELPPGRIVPGEVILTLGYPLTSKEYGGAGIYGGQNNIVSLAFVPVSIIKIRDSTRSACYRNSSAIPLSPSFSKGGSMIRYGAKSLPYGGWWALPALAGDGFMITGDSAGFVNSARLKGIHLAMKSGMIAAETAFEALRKSDSSASTLGLYPKRIDQSWIKGELWKVRNFHQGFEKGLYAGLVSYCTSASHLRPRPSRTLPLALRHENLRQLARAPRRRRPRSGISSRCQSDGKLTFDKLTDLYHSGTKHEEDQPAHLVIHDTNICDTRCAKGIRQPLYSLLPPNVYEMVEDATAPAALLAPNASA